MTEIQAARSAGPPDSLPVLSRGRHHRPEDGACLMEYVSVLSGEAFSDQPRCTHPALAALARMVNDCIEHNDIRRRLALLAPDLIATGRDPRVTEIVVISCLAGNVGPEPTRTRLSSRAQARARRLARGSFAGALVRFASLLSPAYFKVGAAFQVAFLGIQHLPPRERDERLRIMLRDATYACRRAIESQEEQQRSTGAICGRAAASRS